MMYDVLDLEISTRHNTSDQINVLIICLLYNVTFSAKEIPSSHVITLEQLTFLAECLETPSGLVLLFRATSECFQMWLKMFSIVLQFDTAFCIRWQERMQFKGGIINRYIIKMYCVKKCK